MPGWNKHQPAPRAHEHATCSSDSGPALSPISPRRELGAYEALWLEKDTSFKSLADRFALDSEALPSDYVPAQLADQSAAEVMATLKKAGVRQFGVCIHRAGNYPARLRDARHPVELLYYRGAWEITESRCVAVIGSRQASPDGIRRAQRLARELADGGFTVVSGLAKGVDAAAHRAAIDRGGRTISVVGTPLGTCYPRENRDLQEEIARDHLLISEVPVLRYAKQAPMHNRFFFLERNVTMSALTEGTIIVEAGERSGTLTQARAALHQRRKLFILDSCFHRSDITWPARFKAKGAVCVRTLEDIWSALG